MRDFPARPYVRLKQIKPLSLSLSHNHTHIQTANRTCKSFYHFGNSATGSRIHLVKTRVTNSSLAGGREQQKGFFFGVRLVKSVSGKWSSVMWRMRGAIESVWKCSVKQSKAISDRFAGASVVRKSGSGAGEKWQEKATSRQMDSNY